MTTRAELQDLCVDAAEELLTEPAVDRTLSEWIAAREFPCTGVEAGADVEFRTDLGIRPDAASGEFRPAAAATRADVAVWFTTGRTYDEVGDGVAMTAGEEPRDVAVRLPVFVAEVMGDDFTQYHALSTSEMEFDEADSPHICRTKLPSLRCRLPGEVGDQGLLFVSDYEVELVPARANANRVASDDDIPDDAFRESVQVHLAGVLEQLTGDDVYRHLS
ncbi:hypothetical protein [Halosimplex halophilum]|uniref:hypothetical protein n=1 Tax=Halosimplex halophilum TaxID=2559572 RepID=UPI00107F58A0|nr:hypothetical protein [Halosimplex halophilum]